MENLKTYEVKFRKNKKNGVYNISYVNEPGILVDWIRLSKLKDDKKIFLSLDKSRRIVTGPVMIPNFKILRSAEDLGKEEMGYMFFSANTIKNLQELFMLNDFSNNITLGHEVKTEDAKLIESWIITDPKNDKVNALGFKDLIKGTWMNSYKILTDELWNDIILEKFNGFSIEAQGFDFIEKINMAKDKISEEVTLEEVSKIILEKIINMKKDELK